MNFLKWYRSGEPWIWLSALTVAISVFMVAALLILLAVRGFGHFWPGEVVTFNYHGQRLIGELTQVEQVPAQRMREAGVEVDASQELVERRLIKVGNRDQSGLDFQWYLARDMKASTSPADIIVLERREWGNFYGYLRTVKEQGKVVASGGKAWGELQQRLERVNELHKRIRSIETSDIGKINNQLERLRLKQRALELDDALTAEKLQAMDAEKVTLKQHYSVLEAQLGKLYQAIARDQLVAEISDGRQIEIPLQKVVQAYQPNRMNVGQKLLFYFAKVWEFVSDEPREANTEGGIFPAIFGTVMMVLIMSLMVTPFGVIAAVYLREYAKQGAVTRTIRIAVNNLAGVPSIVYGVFGLGFFIYFLGGNIDKLFFPEALPAPTFGTPGLLWASLTLAILTLPVVIVATEEGLARIPQSIREGSLALGATKIETLWRTVLPMASPSIMTGMILAIARAAGEVAPLMLVGVVKLAPALPLDGSFPFLHLDRKFMHLGFHIYDVGFQSPNVEAARPLVFATALLLVLVILVLNCAAIVIRNRLRERYRALEM